MVDELRRLGFHELKVSGVVLHQAIVEVLGDRVVNYYEFTDEVPMTEWIGGTCEIINDKLIIEK
ncbi:MAG: hypothetical protein KBA74_02100 [Prevotella sp.]|jgi:hypothetical protein|nr:hypothetical protein [Prevotella sp.]MBP6526851.1 hypothetical protein [Prevotella sp.]MBP7097461.1 hypothetical protein [Prevotella sp.]MBP8686201.1 hypothetical protein [Prevotella sp.]MBP9981820.1 hypothetical protein [Prevotella sp.]MCI1731530.1 hypothetical protein [Prevotella sp.]